MQFNALAFAAILLAGETLASKVSYVSYYNGKNIQGKDAVVNEKKLGGTIDDSKDAEVIKDIGTWSDHKCSASQHAATKIITVVNTGGKSSPLANKNAALERNTLCQQAVNQHTKST